jgi:hypothetical protein
VRDPKRIDKILKMIEKLWKANPDWRLGQLVVNVMSTDSGSGIPMRPTENEIFNFEDDKLIKAFEKVLKKWCDEGEEEE